MDEGQYQSNRKERLCAVRHLSTKPHKNREPGSNTSACNIFSVDREKGLNEAKLIILLTQCSASPLKGMPQGSQKTNLLVSADET